MLKKRFCGLLKFKREWQIFDKCGPQRPLTDTKLLLIYVLPLKHLNLKIYWPSQANLNLDCSAISNTVEQNLFG